MWWKSLGASAEVRAKSELLYSVATSSATMTLDGLCQCVLPSVIHLGGGHSPKGRVFFKKKKWVKPFFLIEKAELLPKKKICL